MSIDSGIILKLLVAILIGGIIGAEREYRNKSAGLRTMMLICLGAALFTMFSIEITVDSPDRIASNIVVGIGFVGAGVIFRGGGGGINGITTAATIWVTAALGMGVGAGHEWVALTGCVALVGILSLFTILERWMDRLNNQHDYKIVYHSTDIKTLEQYEYLFRQYHLSFHKGIFSKTDDLICGQWYAQGHEKNHQRFIEQVLKDPLVKEFCF
jgi:putative Mg2+ transporter-C (MgtC) family protein